VQDIIWLVTVPVKRSLLWILWNNKDWLIDWLIKPAPRSYNKGSRGLHPFEIRHPLLLVAFTRTGLNVLASTGVMRVWSLTTRPSTVLGGDCINVLLHCVPTRTHSWELDPAWGTLQSVTIALHLPTVHWSFVSLKISLSSQLETYLQTVVVEQFLENHDIVEHSACRVVD
jgi:hypothetical protein